MAAPHGADRGWSRRVIGPFTVRHLVVALVILVAAAALLALLGTPITSPGSPGTQTPGSGFYQIGEPTEGLAIGQLAPELEGPVDGQTVGLVDLEGEPLRLADLRGRPVWLSFFATWCPPCQEETPVLREAFERYGPEGLRMVAVSVQETTADDVARLGRDVRPDLPHRLRRLERRLPRLRGLRAADARVHRPRRRHPRPALRAAGPRAGGHDRRAAAGGNGTSQPAARRNLGGGCREP